jgi:two-component system LytT family response regulator
MSGIRTLIVDDEPLAREGVRQLLAAHPDVEILGECADGFQAVETIESAKPDLVFLDVQMPELDGFGVLQAIELDELPVIIFVTAYDNYALQAFNIHAVDYLLKPLDPERFRIALGRARAEIALREAHHINENLRALLRTLKNTPQYQSRLIVKSSGRVTIVKTADVDWIGAEDDYACLHAQGRKHLLRETMSGLENQLDPDRFIRIHRSTIVNVERIKELRPLFHGDYAVVLNDGTKLTASRTYKKRLDKVFDHML